MDCKKSCIPCVGMVAIVVIALLVALYCFPVFTQYLFYLRVPLISAALLVFFPAIAIYVLPSFLANLFVLNSRLQLASVIVMALLASLAVVTMGDVILDNAPARFSLSGSFAWWPSSQPWLSIVSVAVALPICWCAFKYSLAEIGPAKSQSGAVYGALAAFALHAAVFFMPENPLGNFLKTVLTYLAKIFLVAPDQGYLVGDKLAPGHLLAVSFLAVAAAIYLGALVALRPSDKPKQKQAPALFYLLELILVWSCIFSLLTFSLDYLRVPVLLLFVAFSATVYWLCNVDHFYLLHKADGKPQQLDSLKAVAARLEHSQPGKPEKTLVVVCASGGGIQAAGWTARVLTGLQQEVGEDFVRAVGLVSSVSGGSVGSMYVLDRFSNGRADPGQLQQIFDAATEDSLGATGWGLAYPDLWRFVGLPFLRTKPRDRGAAIDLRWKSAMLNGADTLYGWNKKVMAGELPIPVFNSTIVENGYAYRLSPVDLHPTSPSLVDFTAEFPGYDIDISTAALLSATFPYITPITRNSNPDCADTLPAFHLADGGYFDNFGVVSAVDWLNYLLEEQAGGRYPAKHKIHRVIFITINAFPKAMAPLPTEATAKPAGWLMAVLGPAFAIANVRNSTQAQRNQESITQLADKWKHLGVTIKLHDITFPDKIPFFDIPWPEFGWISAAIKLHDNQIAQSNRWQQYYLKARRAAATKFVDMRSKTLKTKPYNPPLSWKLTKEQKAAIEAGWRTQPTQDAVQKIKNDWK